MQSYTVEIQVEVEAETPDAAYEAVHAVLKGDEAHQLLNVRHSLFPKISAVIEPDGDRFSFTF